MRSKPEDVASGMHRPAGESMWGYPADDGMVENFLLKKFDPNKHQQDILDMDEEIFGGADFKIFENSQGFVFEDAGGKVRAYILYQLDSQDQNVHFRSLGTHPSALRQGLARKLLSAGLREVDRLGYSSSLSIDPDFHSRTGSSPDLLRQIYGSFGFVNSGKKNPIGNEVWKRPASEVREDKLADIIKEAIGLTSIPAEQSKDYQFEQSPHIKDSNNTGVIDVDTVVDLPPVNYFSEFGKEMEDSENFSENLSIKDYFKRLEVFKNSKQKRAFRQEFLDKITKRSADQQFPAAKITEQPKTYLTREQYAAALSKNSPQAAQQYQDSFLPSAPKLNSYLAAGIITKEDLDQSYKLSIPMAVVRSRFNERLKRYSQEVLDDIMRLVSYVRNELYRQQSAAQVITPTKSSPIVAKGGSSYLNKEESFMTKRNQDLILLANDLHDKGYVKEAELINNGLLKGAHSQRNDLRKLAQTSGSSQHMTPEAVIKKHAALFEAAWNVQKQKEGFGDNQKGLWFDCAKIAIQTIQRNPFQTLNLELDNATLNNPGPMLWQYEINQISARATVLLKEVESGRAADERLSYSDQPPPPTSKTGRSYRFLNDQGTVKEIQKLLKGIKVDGFWWADSTRGETEKAWNNVVTDEKYKTTGSEFERFRTAQEALTYLKGLPQSSPTPSTPTPPAAPSQGGQVAAPSMAPDVERYLTDSIQEMMDKNIKFNTPFRPEAKKTKKWVKQLGANAQAAAKQIMNLRDWTSLIQGDEAAKITGGRTFRGKTYSFRSGDFFEAIYQALKSAASKSAREKRGFALSHFDYIIKKSKANY